MNLEYLRYAVEVSRTRSINKAAENLFISQPNLSRTITKLEDEVGFKIFNRSIKGIEPTIAGSDFLNHAEAMLYEYDRIRAINNPDEQIHSFSISIPKAAYLTKAFTNFVIAIKDTASLSIDYKECNALGAINNIMNKGFNLGVIRYEEQFSPIFNAFLEDCGLIGRKICSFEFLVALSKNDPLAQKTIITVEELNDYIEISHGDTFLPYGDKFTIGSDVLKTKRNIRVYDSMGQLAMLQNIPNSFMIVSPLADETMQKYNLVQRRIDGISRTACDVLVFKKNYHQSKLDKLFIDEVERQLEYRSNTLHK